MGWTSSTRASGSASPAGLLVVVSGPTRGHSFARRSAHDPRQATKERAESISASFVKPRRRVGYREAILTDFRGKTLAYVDRLALHPTPSGGGTVGLGGVTLAPSVLERLGNRGIPRVRVVVRGIPRLEISGLRLSFHSGGRATPEGGRHCEAAVGSFRQIRRV